MARRARASASSSRNGKQNFELRISEFEFEMLTFRGGEIRNPQFEFRNSKTIVVTRIGCSPERAGSRGEYIKPVHKGE